jgi:hypothetical protein
MREVKDRSTNKSDGKALDIFTDYLALVVVSVSVVSITMLIFDVFMPKVAFFGGASLALLPLSYFKKEGITIASPHKLGLFAIGFLMLLALVFRADPYPWINGGQDQGVYVSMSSYYQHGGGIFIEDNVLPHLSSDETKNTYLDSRRNGGFHPGVYYGGEKDYVFQFYHLHPLWMGIFADLFGDDARTYSLVFFSILSIVFLALLAYELSNSRLVALSAGVLLAINPLHAFFSKWPVTENVALAFSSMAFYYLARAYRLSENVIPARSALVVSCLSLSMLFFVRITGFLYLPGLFLLFIVGTWLARVKKQNFGFDLIVYVIACVALYISSIFYGLKFSPLYSVDIYRGVFGKLSGLPWAWVLGSGLALMFMLMLICFYLAGRPKITSKIAPYMSSRFLTNSMLALIFLVCAVSLYKMFLVGYTDVYAADRWLGERWKLSGSGLQAVMRSSVLNWVLYTSPFLVVSGFLALWIKKIDIRVSLLFAMFAVGLGAVVFKHPILPYQYYYARYLLSEAVPYGIVIFSVVILVSDSLFWRRFGIGVIALSILTFGIFTFKQFGAEEGVRPLHVLKNIASHVDEGDLLLVEPEGWRIPRFGVETPLRFYFGLKTFALDSSSRKANLESFADDFRNIWLLSPQLLDTEYFKLVKRTEHYDKVMERSGHVPLEVVNGFWRQELFLYVMKKPGWPSTDGKLYLKMRDYTVATRKSEVQSLLGTGWHSMENKHVWSTPTAEITLKSESFENNTLPQSVTLHFRPFAASQSRPVTLHVTACGKTQDFTYRSSERTSIHLPGISDGASDKCKITIKINDATSPKELGQSGDARELGIALYQIDLE